MSVGDGFERYKFTFELRELRLSFDSTLQLV